jgi:hypothetical protein
MANEAVAVPPEVVVPLAAFVTDDTVWICSKYIQLKPWRRLGGLVAESSYCT